MKGKKAIKKLKKKLEKIERKQAVECPMGHLIFLSSTWSTIYDTIDEFKKELKTK